MLRRLAILLAVVALLAGGFVLHARASFDRDDWLEDYAALKDHLGVAYANLDWMRERRGVDTRALDRRTEAALRAARTDRGARKALEAFVRAFDDPHLRLELPAPAWWRRIEGMWRGESEEPVPAGASGADACRSLGYGDSDAGFGLAVEALPGWRPVSRAPFPAGAFQLPDGRPAGIVRIESFSEHDYRDVCVAAWEAWRPDTACGPDCLPAFRPVVQDSLTGRLASAVSALGSRGIDVLVVDLTGNGGGSEWVGRVGGVLTERPLRAPAIGFVKHAHWTERLEESAARIGRDLADTSLPRGARDTLAEARRRIEAALAEARAPCDRAFLWAGGQDLPACSGVVAGRLYGSGAFDWLPPGSLAGTPSRDAVYGGADPGAPAWRGPLWILVDGGTASAAEELPAVLADNGAARVAGERTFGAGCGYTNGGIGFALPHSGLQVHAPDCARYRRDGTNEVEGVAPDAPLPWSELGGDERARALVEVLAKE
jgi:hypothetical protein